MLLCLSGLAHAGYEEYSSAMMPLMDETTANDAEGAAAMLRLAESGDMDAQAYMAYLYSQGIGVARDPAASAHWDARALAHPQVTDKVRNSLQSLRTGDGSTLLVAIFLRMDATSRAIEQGAQMVKEASAELEELMPRLAAADAALEEALNKRDGVQADAESDLRSLSELQALQSQLDSGALGASAPAPAHSGDAGAQETALKAIYAKAIAGDAQAKVDLATLYFLGETKGIVAQQNDLHCYFWSLQIDPKYDPTAAVMADGCGEALLPMVRQNVVTIVESLKERPRPAPLPTTRDQAVADFIAGLEFDDKKQLRGMRREDLSTLGDGWGLFVGHRYGLWHANDALARSVCGKPCAPEAAAAGILEAAWETLWRRFGWEPAYQPAKPIMLGGRLQRALVRVAVTAFLEQVDSDAPETTWADASPLMREKHRSADAWAARARGFRSGVGAVRDRSDPEYAFSARVDDLPAGEYVVVSIATTFANRNARERIVLQKDLSGWRILDYAMTEP